MFCPAIVGRGHDPTEQVTVTEQYVEWCPVPVSEEGSPYTREPLGGLLHHSSQSANSKPWAGGGVMTLPYGHPVKLQFRLSAFVSILAN